MRALCALRLVCRRWRELVDKSDEWEAIWVSMLWRFTRLNFFTVKTDTTFKLFLWIETQVMYRCMKIILTEAMLQWRFANWWSMIRTTITRQVHRQLLQGMLVVDLELVEMVPEFQDELTLARHLLTVVLVVHCMPESEDDLHLSKLNRHVGDIEGATGLPVLRLVHNVTATTGQHHQPNEFHDILSIANVPAESIQSIINLLGTWNSEETSFVSHLEQLIPITCDVCLMLVTLQI